MPSVVQQKTPIPCTSIVRAVPLERPFPGRKKEEDPPPKSALCDVLDREFGGSVQDDEDRKQALHVHERRALTEQRNPTGPSVSGDGEIYGIVFDRETDALVPINESNVIGQDVIDEKVREKSVSSLKTIETVLETGETRSVIKRVLTYFSENKIDIVGGEDKIDDDNDDAVVDLFKGTGLWVGVARLYMTPLTIGYKTLATLSDKTDESWTFSADTPYVVRVLSCTFGVSSVTLKAVDQTGLKYLGPVRTTMRGVPCTVAYIAPDKIKDDEQIQDAGDSYIVQRKELFQGDDGKSYETFFCGTGLTTRTRKGYEANNNKPLYDAGMQRMTETRAAETGVSVGISSATHKLVLETTSRTGATPANNKYDVKKLTDDEKDMQWTAKHAIKFQDKQIDANQTSTPAGVEVPLWGAVQVEVPLSAIRGYVVSSVVSSGGDVTAIESAVVNTNLVLSVEVAVDKAGDAQGP